jgi:hypothetical protein
LRKWVTGTSFLVTQPYLSYRCWLLHAQAVSAAPAASFKSFSGNLTAIEVISASLLRLTLYRQVGRLLETALVPVPRPRSRSPCGKRHGTLVVADNWNTSRLFDQSPARSSEPPTDKSERPPTCGRRRETNGCTKTVYNGRSAKHHAPDFRPRNRILRS